MNSPLPRLLLALCTAVMSAAAATLKIGDPAPKLQTGRWIQGDPVKTFEPGKAYIVEFWATWCGPCRTSIPHLNAIAKKYQDQGLIVIGQDVWENDESAVEPFVKKMGEKMTYRVALDDKQDSKKGKMAETWMEAAGQGGIPTAFVVDTKGQVAWIGHPMTLPEPMLTEVLAGKYDLAKAAANFEAEKRKEEELQVAWGKVNRAMRAKNWDEAGTQLEEFAKLLPESERSDLDRVRLDILFGKQDYSAAYKLMAQMADARKDQAMFQNDLAWKIVSDKSIQQRDLKLADTLAVRANEASKGEDPAILDTLARVRFLQDKRDEAIALQEKAIGLADAEMKPGLQKTLESYRKGIVPSDE